METLTPACRPRPLRVLVVDGDRPASVALAELLREHAMLEMRAAAASLMESFVLAGDFHPHVVLLDFHGLPASVALIVKRFKQIVPPPRVLVLTHDGSVSMRRRCRDAHVDGVFDKTTELPQLAEALGRIALEPDFSGA